MDGIDGIVSSEATFVAWSGAPLTAPAASGAACRDPRGHLLWIPALELARSADIHGRCRQRLSRLRDSSVGVGDTGGPGCRLGLADRGGVFFVDPTVPCSGACCGANRSTRHIAVMPINGLHVAREATSGLPVGPRGERSRAVPCAVFVTRRPSLAAATVIFAFAPLVLLAIATLGRREANDREQRRQVRRRVNHLTGSPLGVTLSLRPDALH